MNGLCSRCTLASVKSYAGSAVPSHAHARVSVQTETAPFVTRHRVRDAEQGVGGLGPGDMRGDPLRVWVSRALGCVFQTLTSVKRAATGQGLPCPSGANKRDGVERRGASAQRPRRCQARGFLSSRGDAASSLHTSRPPSGRPTVSPSEAPLR